MELGDFTLSPTESLSNLKVTLAPQGEPEKFDFDLSFDKNDFIGPSSKEVRFVGTADLLENGNKAGTVNLGGNIDLLRVEI